MELFKSINPFSGQELKTHSILTQQQLDDILRTNEHAQRFWQNQSISHRSDKLIKCSELLIENKIYLAELITIEMGKNFSEAIAEVEKSANVCLYYANNAESMLSPETIKTTYSKSRIQYSPLGAILAIMPWNFPVWQAFRFIAPTLMAGNTVLLKHATNVGQTALAIENILRLSMEHEGIYQNLFCSHKQVAELIASPQVKGVTLTGSERAGSSVAQLAGQHLKPCVLELGGNDPFIVLEDADIDWCVEQAIKSRMNNMGQTCIAAKRFIIHHASYSTFLSELKKRLSILRFGDPKDASSTLVPLARLDCCTRLESQLNLAKQQGAKIIMGGSRIENTYSGFQPTIVTELTKSNTAFTDELFGPVFSLLSSRSDDESIRIANNSRFGLGASLWTNHPNNVEPIIDALNTGNVFINEIVKSSPELPFGGIKQSGFGRELSKHGILSFTNCKTVCFK